jgi:2-dehydro-3-deoxyglucarate aldolase/4-hydroxy-2-oxoheptanedioate aldolase
LFQFIIDGMDNAQYFRQKLHKGELCLGTCISFTDPTVTEALCTALDFVWIDMEHGAFSPEAVQAHIMATKGSRTTPIVRVPWNDPVLIKPVLDMGAAGIIAPQVRTAAEARQLVAACLYPPHGIRGYGPRRPSNYGRDGGVEFCRRANDSLIVIAQIEHIDAVEKLDEILQVPGLTSIVLGPNDLAGSMGHIGNVPHPDVMQAIETVIRRAQSAKVPVGLAGGDIKTLLQWTELGVQWVAIASDAILMLRGTDAVVTEMRARSRTASVSGA